jgi:hypothetical protein
MHAHSHSLVGSWWIVSCIGQVICPLCDPLIDTLSSSCSGHKRGWLQLASLVPARLPPGVGGWELVGMIWCSWCLQLGCDLGGLLVLGTCVWRGADLREAECWLAVSYA